jgi:hypothetical protein
MGGIVGSGIVGGGGEVVSEGVEDGGVLEPPEPGGGDGAPVPESGSLDDRSVSVKLEVGEWSREWSSSVAVANHRPDARTRVVLDRETAGVVSPLGKGSDSVRGKKVKTSRTTTLGSAIPARLLHPSSNPA